VVVGAFDEAEGFPLVRDGVEDGLAGGGRNEAVVLAMGDEGRDAEVAGVVDRADAGGGEAGAAIDAAGAGGFGER